MKTIVLFVALLLTGLCAQAQQQPTQEVIQDTTGLMLDLESICGEIGHGRGLFIRHIDAVAVDTLVENQTLFYHVVDDSYTIYKCFRCGHFYRYPHSGYCEEFKVPIGKVE